MKAWAHFPNFKSCRSAANVKLFLPISFYQINGLCFLVIGHLWSALCRPRLRNPHLQPLHALPSAPSLQNAVGRRAVSIRLPANPSRPLRSVVQPRHASVIQSAVGPSIGASHCTVRALLAWQGLPVTSCRDHMEGHHHHHHHHHPYHHYHLTSSSTNELPITNKPRHHHRSASSPTHRPPFQQWLHKIHHILLFDDSEYFSGRSILFHYISHYTNEDANKIWKCRDFLQFLFELLFLIARPGLVLIMLLFLIHGKLKFLANQKAQLSVRQNLWIKIHDWRITPHCTNKLYWCPTKKK